MSDISSLGLTELEFGEALAYRERYEGADRGGAALEAGVPMGLTQAEVEAWSDDAIRRLVSTDAYQRTVEWETGGRAYYDKKLTMPTWPGAQSGVTIGVGFDLGYHSAAEIEAAWGDQLARADVQRLITATGIKVDAARRLAGELADIRVPWQAAEAVFVRATLPKYARMVLRHVANAADLHPHAFGALFSLVFNRGASFQRSGDRYSEMRAIALAMADRKTDEIPDLIVKMKRLWPSNLSGLLKRRDGEAALFRRGIEDQKKIVVAAAAPVAEGSSAALAGESAENYPIDDSEPETAPPLPEAYKGKVYKLGDVKWVEGDERAPDYRHIRDKALAGKAYSITVDDIDLIVKANRYQPIRDNGRIIFGLRGAQLAGGKMCVDAASLELVDVRPNHRDYRCVIGVMNLETRKLSGFVASTVPNANAVLRGWQLNSANAKEFRGNMLTTGCYPYVIGAHGAKQVPGCLLQGTSVSQEDRAWVIALRSLKDVSYDGDDYWHYCKPHDNLHPGFLATGFSSEGCQTIRGQFVNGAHTGDFAAFKQALGKPGTSGGGARFDYVLSTGLEAALAVNLRVRGLAGDPVIVQEELGRLRQGSRGVEVAALQRFLGRPETGVLDARDREALIERQIEAGIATDGILSPDLDRKLSINAFAPTNAPIVVASAETASIAPARGQAHGAPERMAVHISEHMAELMAASGDSLLYEIGRRAALAGERGESALARDVAASGMPATEFGFTDFVAIGTRLFDAAQAEMARIVCGGDSSDRQIRDAVSTIVKKKVHDRPSAPAADASNGNGDAGTGEPQPAHESEADTELALVLARVLVQRLGIVPVIAQPLAALLVNRVFKSTIEETCRRWLPSKGAETAALPGGARPEAAMALAGGGITPELVEASLGKSESDLLAEIGRASQNASGGSAGAASPEAFGLPSFVTDHGFALFRRLEAQLHGLICGRDGGGDGVREQLATALGMDPSHANRAGAVAAVAAAIVAQLAILPAVAVPVATLLLTKYLDKGVDFGCERWGAAIAAAQGGQQSGAQQPELAAAASDGAMPIGLPEAMVIAGRLTPAAYMLFASDMLPVAEIKKAKEQHLHIMVGFDSGNIPRSGPISEAAYKTAKDLGAELQIYVEGPGGPTGNSWLPDERKRIQAAARSVGIDTSKKGWQKLHWQTHGWRTFTFDQLADYKKQGFNAAEIDNLGWVIDEPEEFITFLGEYAARYAKGELPQLVMKNLDHDYIEAVVRAVEAKLLPREMFSEFHICEKSCGYDTGKIGDVSRRIAIRTLLSTDTHRYDAKGVYGYEAEFDAAHGKQRDGGSSDVPTV